MSSVSGNRLKKPISDRISIFEKSQANQTTGSNSRGSPSSPVITTGRNISALKSQFSAAVAHDLTPPPKSPILIPKNSVINNKSNSPTEEPNSPEPITKNPLSEGKQSAKSKAASTPNRLAGGKSSSSGAAKTPLKSPTKTRKSTTSTPTPQSKSSSSRINNRPVSPTKKASTSTLSSPSVKKPLGISRSSTGTKSSSSPMESHQKASSLKSKRPGSPTKTPAGNEPSKKLSLSRILSPEPKKEFEENLSPIKESKKDPLLERKESSKSVLDRRDSNKSILERRDSSRSVSSSTHPVLDRTDSNKSVFDRKDSTKSLLDRKNSSQFDEIKDSTTSLAPERKDSSQSVFDPQERPSSVLDRNDSNYSVFDPQEGPDAVLGRKDSNYSVFDSQERSSSVSERKLSNQSVIDPQEDDDSTVVFERKDSVVLEEESPAVHSPVIRQESVISVFERKESVAESLDEGSVSGQGNDNSLESRLESSSVLGRSIESLGGGESIQEEQRTPSAASDCDQEESSPCIISEVPSFPPPRCVTPPPPKEDEDESPASIPIVKVTVEDIQLVKKDSSSQFCLPPSTVLSDLEDDDEEDDRLEEEDVNARLNLRNKEEEDESRGYRRNSIEKHIDTRVINANFMKNQNSTVSAPSPRYWTNQALQNDNSQTISEALKLDLEFKEEKIVALNKELEELHNGGAVEEEISHLKKQKADLDARLMDQEEELDDLAGQVQMLEQSKIKLEMSIAAQKKEHRKELSSKEEELEDARAAAQKRIKALEQQLENEHEERMGFVREKHDLETKIMNLQEIASRSTDEEYVIKLKKNLKKTKALLKDAQCMIDMNRNDSSNKIVLRQLKNQLEDAEFAKTAAIKSRQNTEMELTEVQQQLDDVMRSKNDIEDKMMRICREKSDALTQLEDNEEELGDIMKKYKAAVSQLSVDQITITQQTTQITELEEERHRLKETLSELNQKIDNLESDNISSVTHSRLELKIRELESKLELEQATRGRMETQIGRLKEAIEKYNHECDILKNKELNSQDMARKLQRQLRDSKEDYASLAQKEMEANAKKLEYEKQLELAEAEVITVKNDLKLSLKRFDQLQASLEGDSSEGDCISDGESDSSDCEVSIFLDHHRRAMSVQKERESVARELSAQRELRASVAREMSLRPLETMSEHPEEASTTRDDKDIEHNADPVKEDTTKTTTTPLRLAEPEVDEVESTA